MLIKNPSLFFKKNKKKIKKDINNKKIFIKLIKNTIINKKLQTLLSKYFIFEILLVYNKK